jgi:D-alanine--poly(phosphoribitol) ligase subunit 1
MQKYLFNLGLRFEEIVSKYSNLNALQFDSNCSFTYNELNSHSNQIAFFLKEKKKLKKDDVIMISGDKSFFMFSAILASLKIGLPYVVYDPEGPLSRLKAIIIACNPKLIIKSKEDKKFNHKKISFIFHEKINLKNFPIKNLKKQTLQINGSQIAYIMFTSGSTGNPKGAMISHSNVINLIDWSINEFKFGPKEKLTNLNPSYFDNFVFDFFSSLFSGASLVVFKKKEILDPIKLIKMIDAYECTSMFSVPTLLIFFQTMKVFNSKNLKKIKRIIFGGEGYPKSKLLQLYKLYKKRIKFYNVYGPTECTCICSSYEISKKDFISLNELMPLGNLIPNYDFKILSVSSDSKKEVFQGELALLGPSVGYGYINNQFLTDRSFIQNPFNKTFSEKIYLTGDLVKIKNNKLHILGRIDNQIKHLGYRIEIEEIESNIMKLGYVNHCCCFQTKEDDISEIVAVLSVNKKVKLKKLTEDLKIYLPDYMIPQRIIFGTSLPTNANGKLDRIKIFKIFRDTKKIKSRH